MPINPGDQIPFNDFRRHCGKGQTGAVVSLPPGPHRVRLLFANHEHRPYFVFSPEVHITVRGPRAALGPGAGVRDAHHRQWPRPALTLRPVNKNRCSTAR